MLSLGLKTVTTAGTAVVLSATKIRCTKIWIQPLKALNAAAAEHTDNVGTLYIMNSSTAKGAASTNIMAVIPTGADTILLEASQKGGYDLSTIYLDAVNNGDGALVNYV